MTHHSQAKYELIARFYEPKEALLQGSWRLPKVDSAYPQSRRSKLLWTLTHLAVLAVPMLGIARSSLGGRYAASTRLSRLSDAFGRKAKKPPLGHF